MVNTVKDTVLVIRCSKEVKKAFKRYAVDFSDYQEALIELLRLAGVWKEKGKIY